MFTSAMPPQATAIANTLPWLVPATMPVTGMPEMSEAVAIQRPSFPSARARARAAGAGAAAAPSTRRAISRSTRSASEAAIASSYSGPSSRRAASAAAISVGVRSAAVMNVR